MAYLLDSDVSIDFLSEQLSAVEHFDRLVGKEIFISVIALSEILYGIQKGNNSEKMIRSFRGMIYDFHIRALPMTEPISKEFVRVKIELEKKGQKIADFDLIIASTALVHGLTLLTRNTRHFSRVPHLRLL